MGTGVPGSGIATWFPPKTSTFAIAPIPGARLTSLTVKVKSSETVNSPSGVVCGGWLSSIGGREPKGVVSRFV